MFDHNVPARLRLLLPGHTVITSRELGWDTLKNGDLLHAAEVNGFEVMVTGDKNIRYRENLEGRKLALIVLPTKDWGTLKQKPATIVAALERAKPGSFKAVEVQAKPSHRRPVPPIQ